MFADENHRYPGRLRQAAQVAQPNLSGEQRMPSVTLRILQFVQFVSAAAFALALTVISAHATSRIKDGQRIRVDGGRGVVTIL